MRHLAILALCLSSCSLCGTSYSVEILRLDFENSSNFAEDTSGAGVVGAGTVNFTGFSGTLTQSADAQSGSFSASFNSSGAFDGAIVKFDDTVFPIFLPDDSYSVSYWVQPTSAFLSDGEGFRGIISATSENNFPLLDWQFDNGDTVDGGVGDGTTTFSRFNSDNFLTNLVTAGDLTAGQWTDITLSYNSINRSLALFVDGVLKDVSNDPAGSSMENFIVGANRGESRVFDGLLDDVRVFDNPIVVDDLGNRRSAGDLNFSGGLLTIADWLAFRSGIGADFSALTSIQAYQLGDLDFDGDNDVEDFNTFKELYELDNGSGSLALAIATLPEPGTAVLSLLAAVAFGTVRRPRGPLMATAVRRAQSSRGEPTSGRYSMNWYRLLAILLLVSIVVSSSECLAAQFDFGNGSIDATTGVAANFVIAENQLFGTVPGNQSLTVDGIGLTIAPIIGGSADFGMSTWGANTQGIGIRSLDAGGTTAPDIGANGGQRRRINSNAGEAIEFFFDTTVVIDSIRLGSLAPSGTGGIETAEISFVSGTDPFAGGSFTIDSDPNVSTAPDEDLIVGVEIEAGTVLSLTASSPITGGVLWNDIVVSLPPVDPLTLQVFTDTGEMRLVNNSTVDFDIDYLTITSADVAEDGGSLDSANYTGLAGAPGFPAGSDDGTGWEAAENNDDLQIVEAFLLGDSTIATTDAAVSLGTGFIPGATEDLTFTYHIAGSGNEEVTGTIEYLTGGGQPGDFDGDGDVDGLDFLVWQREDGSASGLLDWQNNYGVSSVAPAGGVVPEPGALLLSSFCVSFFASSRVRLRKV